MQGILSHTWRVAEKTGQDRRQCQWGEYVQTAEVKKGCELRRKKKDHEKRKSSIFQGRSRMGSGNRLYREPPQRISWKTLLGIKELWVILSHPRNTFSPRDPLFISRSDNCPESALWPLQTSSSVGTWASGGRAHPCGAMAKAVLGKP